MMDGIREGYEFFVSHAGVAYVDESYRDWDKWITSVEREIEAFAGHLQEFEGYQTGTEQLAGDVAEFWHADTFNIRQAVNRSTGPRAEVLRSHGYGSADIKLGDRTYQSKYYRNANASLRAQSRTFGQDARQGSKSAQALIDAGHVGENDSVYGEQTRLVPTDQVEEVRQAASRRYATESARRPEQAQRYKEVKDNLTGTIGDGRGTTSMGLTREDATRLAIEAENGEIDPRNWGLSTDQLIDLREVMNESLRAGMSAAAMSAVLEAAPVVIEAVRHLIAEGEFDDIALAHGASAAVSGAAKGFLIGTMTAAITYAARAGYIGLTARQLDPGVVGSIAAWAVKALTSSVKTAEGGMTRSELASSIGRDAIIATCSMIAGGISQAAIQIPVFGYLLGSFVGSAVGGIVWSFTESTTVALCAERGLALFGLVKRNYEVPEQVFAQIGIEPIEADALAPDSFGPELSEPNVSEKECFGSAHIGVRQLRRGVLEVGRIGYNAW